MEDERRKRRAMTLRKLAYKAELLSLGPANEEKNDAKEEDQNTNNVVEPAAPTDACDAKPYGHVLCDEGYYSYTIVRENYPAPCTIF